jgi:transcription elongation factor GreA
MNTEKHYLTKDKFEELTKELEQLRTTGRKEVAEELEYSKQLGDLSENAEYHQARERQALLEDRIARLDALLKAAAIVDAHHTEVVNIGSTIQLQKQGDKKVSTYTLVGTEEADVPNGKISITSPIGNAVKGKKKGDMVMVETKAGKMKYEIVKIV